MTTTPIKAVTATSYALNAPYIDAMDMVDPCVSLDDELVTIEDRYSWDRYQENDQWEEENFVALYSENVYNLTNGVADNYSDTYIDTDDYEYCQ